jgi:hypothetical protein
VLPHLLLAFGPCIVVEPIRGRVPGLTTTLDSILQQPPPSLGFGVLLRLIYQEQFRSRFGL